MKLAMDYELQGNTASSSEDLERFRSDDNISHFMCRLAYSRSEELRQWFQTQESRLFRIRLKEGLSKNVSDSNAFLDKIMQQVDMKAEKVSDQEWSAFKDRAIFDVYRQQGQEVDQNNFVKVPFKSALSLVGKRACFMYGGYLYVNKIKHLQTLLSENFKEEINRLLVFTQKHLGTIVKDPRMKDLLRTISQKDLIDFEYKSNQKLQGKIHPNNIDAYAQKHFPPCMRVLHTQLTQQSHLKHYGRLQYGLFLKGVGLTLDESLYFWKQQFRRKIDGEKFDKQYAYNVRHSYGQEGKRTDYTPWTCKKILGSVPGPGEYHGCPIKVFNEEMLTKYMISQYGLTSEQAKVVIDKRRENSYQAGCLKLWEASHPNGVPDNVGNSPNAYFDSSIDYLEKVDGGKKIQYEQDTEMVEA